MERAIHTAVGVRDIYGSELRMKREILRNIHDVFAAAAYEDIETPTFEYFDVFGSKIGTTPSRELFKFFDRDGDTLVLRPDFTPSVARAVAMYFGGAARPLRLCYEGNTFVNAGEFQGRPKEMTQSGIERLGEDSAIADAEVIAVTIRALLAAGLKEFQVSIGEVEFFRSLAETAGLNEEETEEIRHLISRKNFFGVEDVIAHTDIPQDQKKAFVRLPQLFGGTEVLTEAETFALTEKARTAIKRLRDIAGILADEGLDRYITFDFGMLSKFHYYTGIIFSAYTFGSGEPVAKGGRYDELLTYFGGHDPAVGAVISVDPLLGALMRGIPGNQEV